MQVWFESHYFNITQAASRPALPTESPPAHTGESATAAAPSKPSGPDTVKSPEPSHSSHSSSNETGSGEMSRDAKIGTGVGVGVAVVVFTGFAVGLILHHRVPRAPREERMIEDFPGAGGAPPPDYTDDRTFTENERAQAFSSLLQDESTAYGYHEAPAEKEPRELDGSPKAHEFSSPVSPMSSG